MRAAERPPRAPLVVLSCLALGLWAGGLGAQAPPDLRGDDPVVLTGSALGRFVGQPPERLVAFRYDGGWVQVPVQVDQRMEVDVGLVRSDSPAGLTVLGYADAGTLVGPDPDPDFDADDELVFVAGDAGGTAPDGAGWPPGTVESAGAKAVVLKDPDTYAKAYVFLFVSDGSLDPSAGRAPVSYGFNLLSGDYRSTYRFDEGANPEDTGVQTPYYRLHFSDRWVRDELEILAGGSTGQDILDRHKFVFYPGNCGRTEDTFSRGGGGFFANRTGPVRAVRSYLGANSGYATQRDHFFYERRHEIVTYCRVHPIPGALDFLDYSSEALGMWYYNDSNTQGTVIDGAPDAVAAHALRWQMVTGRQGTLTLVHSGHIDVGGAFTVTSYYDDETAPQYVQCTGDSHEYGASGPWLLGLIWNTDPLLGPAGTLTLRQVEYFDPPDQDAAHAQARAAAVERPLEVSVRKWPEAQEPAVAAVLKASNPFRLKVSGSGFAVGCEVRIDGATAPETRFKSGSLVVARGSGLKALVPKGIAVQVTVANPDGSESAPFAFTR